MFYSIFYGKTVSLWPVNPHFPTSNHILSMYLFVELYILVELGMTVIFKRLPTWIRRNLRNLAHGDSVRRSLDSQNQPKVDEIQVSKTLEKGHPLLSSIWLFKKKGLFTKENSISNATRYFPCVQSANPDVAVSV